MALTKTPVCNFGEKPKNFNLLSTENKKISLDDVKGENGTLIMFICNHCPYVKAIIKDVENTPFGVSENNVLYAGLNELGGYFFFQTVVSWGARRKEGRPPPA